MEGNKDGERERPDIVYVFLMLAFVKSSTKG